MMQQAMEQGLRVGKVQRTVDELWQTTCYIVVLLSLIFLVMLVMDTLALRDTLDLRENLQAAITVEGVNMDQMGPSRGPPTMGRLSALRAKARSTIHMWSQRCSSCLPWAINGWPWRSSSRCGSSTRQPMCPGLELQKNHH